MKEFEQQVELFETEYTGLFQLLGESQDSSKVSGKKRRWVQREQLAKLETFLADLPLCTKPPSNVELGRTSHVIYST